MPWSGTSYADGRLFAGHEIESKRGDLRNSAFALKTKTNRKEGAVNMFRKTKRPQRGLFYYVYKFI